MNTELNKYIISDLVDIIMEYQKPLPTLPYLRDIRTLYLDHNAWKHFTVKGDEETVKVWRHDGKWVTMLGMTIFFYQQRLSTENRIHD